MSCASTPSQVCIHHSPRIVVPWYRHVWQATCEALTRHQARQELATLDDRQLSDVGLTRAQVQREACKPFWVR
jgi:uncharacterized protein YjiS (DUF1127 family)